jgi:hypothetical protein
MYVVSLAVTPAGGFGFWVRPDTDMDMRRLGGGVERPMTDACLGH